MPYYPREAPHEAVFGKIGSDVCLAQRLIQEKWCLYYPSVTYNQILVTPTPSPYEQSGDLADGFVTGISGETIVDDLWGEDIIVDGMGDWLQPHSIVDSPAPDAPNTRKFKPPVLLKTHVFQNPSDQVLKRMGIDEQRDLVLTWPLALLDELNIIISIGDTFLWGNETYEILTAKLTGYWKFTNYPLYITSAANRWRHGS